MDSNTSVGQILKSEREKQGFSIEDIANTTRIRASYIQNIEDDDYNHLESTYVLGYIRSYALFLDLDAVEIVNQAKTKVEDNAIEYNNPQNHQMTFDKKFGFFSIFKGNAGSSKQDSDAKYRDISSFEQKSSDSKLLKYFLIFAGSFAIAFAVFFFFGSSKDNESPSFVNENMVVAEENNATVEDSLLDDGFTVQEQAENTPAVQVEEASQVQTKVETSAEYVGSSDWPVSQGPSFITLEFSADSWVRVTNASNKNAIYYDNVAKKGSRLEIPNVSESLAFSVGNSQGVVVVVYGTRYGFVSKRKVVRNIPLNQTHIENNFEVKN